MPNPTSDAAKSRAGAEKRSWPVQDEENTSEGKEPGPAYVRRVISRDTRADLQIKLPKL